MSSFEYIASYPLFYPAKQDAEGNSLMATQGVIVDWDSNPNAAVWVETDEAPTWGAPAPAAPEPEPEVKDEAKLVTVPPLPPAEPKPVVEPVAEPVAGPGGVHEVVIEPEVKPEAKPLFPGYAPPAEPYSR